MFPGLLLREPPKATNVKYTVSREAATEQRVVEQDVRSLLRLETEILNERMRVQANKILSPQDRSNLSDILDGDILDIDIG